MFLWLAPILGAVGFVAYRSWHQEAAIRSGELMDVRDAMPSGDADLEVRVLAERTYRIELQCELRVREGEAASALPYRLVVSECASQEDGEFVYDRERTLGSLLGFAANAQHSPGERRFGGSLPLLELRSESLIRLRFDLSIAPVGEGAALEKASLVVKEDVRPLRAPKGVLDRVRIASREAL